VTHKIKASGNMVLFDRTLEALEMARDGDFVMTNFVDFDRNTAIAATCRVTRRRWRRSMPVCRAHRQSCATTTCWCCLPTTAMIHLAGSDHTREQTPILCFSPNLSAGTVGLRSTFADIGEASPIGSAFAGQTRRSFL